MRIILRMDWESQSIDSLTVCDALPIIGNYVAYIAGTSISFFQPGLDSQVQNRFPLSSPGEPLLVHRAGG